MPFVFSYEDYFDEEGEGNEEAPDFDAEPKLADFKYCSSSEWGGPNGPVTFKPPEPKQLTIDPGAKGNAPYALMEKNATAIVFHALRDLNFKSAYVRYDGGNEEGSVWFDHAVDSAGQKIGAKRLKEMLLEADVVTSINRLNANMHSKQNDAMQLEQSLDSLCNHWLELLLSYWGTGEYMGYGGIRVDLETGLIEDDPKAAPVVQNLQFDGAQYPKDED